MIFKNLFRYQIKLKHADMLPRLQQRLEREYPDLSLSRSNEFGNRQQL